MITKNMLGKSHEHCLSEKDIYGSYKIFFGTLVSESRLRIINMLRHGRKNVTEIIKELGTDQTAVSHDLSRLKKCGFVKSEIEGKYRYYKLNKETINPLMELIDKHMSQYCVHILHGKENKK
ncbi:MAG: metalloregulator ArsR/SmtB family transcription factor [Nanoarchaeota archaeon]